MEKRFEFIDAWNMVATLLAHPQFLEIEAEYEENQSSSDATCLKYLSVVREFLSDIKSKM
jgi:hypothetical protein